MACPISEENIQLTPHDIIDDNDILRFSCKPLALIFQTILISREANFKFMPPTPSTSIGQMGLFTWGQTETAGLLPGWRTILVLGQTDTV